MPLRDSLTPIIDLVFPPRCPLCGEGIAQHGSLCAVCWADLVVPGSPHCTSCARPFPDTLSEGLVCAACLAQPPRHDGIAAATLYTEISRKLVLQLKHGRRLAVAQMFARLMAARLPAVDSEWLAVPVPLHRWRLWSRGYNQSAELARELCRLTGMRLGVDVLVRQKHTPSLGGLGRKARERVLSGAIALHPRYKRILNGASVVLVDDVLTSGATSNACVAALKRAGAKTVVICCFARVLDEALPGGRGPIAKKKRPEPKFRASS